MYHNLGLRPLRNKDLIAPPGKQPKPTEVLVKEEGALQSVGEKGHNDEHLGTNGSSRETLAHQSSCYRFFFFVTLKNPW